jgi:four helix bundle protein
MDAKKFLKLNDIEAFRVSFHLGNYVWDTVSMWNNFSERTVGEQFVKAVGSISANIAERFGRYGKKDKIKFYRYNKGSLSASLNWNEKSKIRKLLSSEEYRHIFGELQKLLKAINSLILVTNQKLKI